MAQDSASQNPSRSLFSLLDLLPILKGYLVGASFDRLTDPPPPAEGDTKEKMVETTKNDPTGQSQGGQGTDDTKKSKETCW